MAVALDRIQAQPWINECSLSRLLSMRHLKTGKENQLRGILKVNKRGQCIRRPGYLYAYYDVCRFLKLQRHRDFLFREGL